MVDSIFWWVGCVAVVGFGTIGTLAIVAASLTCLLDWTLQRLGTLQMFLRWSRKELAPKWWKWWTTRVRGWKWNDNE